MAEVVSMDFAPSGPRESSGLMGAPIYGHSRVVSFASSREKLPNPTFSFPMRASESESLPTSTERSLSTQPNAAPRARQAGIRQRRSASALPDFSFNPSASAASDPSAAGLQASPATPPLSPTATVPTTPSRNIGHRRGGSEFIGGDGLTGGNGLLSTSPTKGDGVLPPPAAPGRLGPPAGRRGHAHRRSGAISCHDLQTILQAVDGNAKPIGGSAPVTPLETDNKIYFAPQSRRTVSQTSFRAPSEPSSPPNETADSSPRKSFSRPRVGFSDHLEFIRPLSTISSETEGSMSTIRGSHSVSGSLSSVLSAGTASPPSLRASRPSLQTTFEEGNLASRPQTASDVLESTSTSKFEFGQALALPERPKSAALLESPTTPTPGDVSPLKSKKRHFDWFNQKRHSRGHSRGQSLSLPASKSEPTLVVTPPDTPALPTADFANEAEEVMFAALTADQDKRPRKSRSWAHSFMSLRHRQRSPTGDADDELSTGPNSGVASPVEELDLALVPDFDADNTVDIITEPKLQPVPAKYSAPSPASFSSAGSPIVEAASPVIDLDAALGPFNTPPLGARSPHVRGVQRRSMHSSGGSGNVAFNFAQPHRRTESAPALVPFEIRNSKMNSSTMADVFEEEEEDDYNSPKRARKVATPHAAIPEEPNDDPGLGIQIVDSIEDKHDNSFAISTAQGLPMPPMLAKSTASPVTSSPSLQAAAVIRSSREVTPVEVVEDFEEPRASSLTKDSDSTVTPEIADEESKQPCPPLQLNLPTVPPSMMTPDTLASSPMSTPDYYRRGSRPSFEMPRVGTAASSFTDTRTMSSFALGESGPEYRCSVDDVPSLTSSRSTMTNTPHHPLSQAQTYADARSTSVGSRPSAGTDRARKRGSIASLSRLISGDSFAGRSKLSIESRPQTGHGDPSEQVKGRKKNRISRLMTFWKSKERLSD